MVGWHHWLNGHEFEWTLGDGGGWQSLACCSPWVHKEWDPIQWLNHNKPDAYNQCCLLHPCSDMLWSEPHWKNSSSGCMLVQRTSIALTKNSFGFSIPSYGKTQANFLTKPAFLEQIYTFCFWMHLVSRFIRDAFGVALGGQGRFLESYPCRGWSRVQEKVAFRCLGAQVAEAGWALACGCQSLGGSAGKGQACPGFCASSWSGTHRLSPALLVSAQVSLPHQRPPLSSHTLSELTGTSSTVRLCVIVHLQVWGPLAQAIWGLTPSFLVSVFWQPPLETFYACRSSRTLGLFCGLKSPWVSHFPGPEFQGMRAVSFLCIHSVVSSLWSHVRKGYLRTELLGFVSVSSLT